jgi:hypothetical protein
LHLDVILLIQLLETDRPLDIGGSGETTENQSNGLFSAEI